MSYTWSFLVFILLTLSFESLAQTESKTGELLFPRYGPTAATDGSWIYVYGGAPHGGRNGQDFVRQGLHASIERVDPITLKSEYFSNGLHRRANHASVFSENRFISCGGRSQIGVLRPKMSSCEYLDVNTGIFRELPALPDSLRTLGMAVVNGEVYVVGGLIKGSNYSNGTYRLSGGSEKWEQLQNSPLGVSGQIVAVGNKIYVIGGYNGSAMKSVMVFDTENGTWAMAKSLPYGLSAYSAVADGDDIFIFGDYTKMDVIHRYETATGNLYLLDQKMTPRRHTAAVLVGDKAIVIGGNQTSSGKALTTIEAFELSQLRNGGRLLEVKE